MLDTKTQVVRAVRWIKKHTCWSQQELADRAGLGVGTINRILTLNKDAPTPSIRVRAALYTLYKEVKAMPRDAD